MRLEKAWLVFRKDWTEIKRNWQVILPIVFISLVFSVLLPLMVVAVPELTGLSQLPAGNVESLIQFLPESIRLELVGMSEGQILLHVMSLYFFAPFFLIIPIVGSGVIASDSFAGEKERRTVETLLATPISDSELLLGKILVSFIPAMLVTALSFGVYSAVVDYLSIVMFNGGLLLPNLNWVFLIFLLSPSVVLASIGLTVIISSRVKGFREAQQISALLLVPVLGIILAELSGALVFGSSVILLLIAGFAALDLVVFRLAVSQFQREKILSNLV